MRFLLRFIRARVYQKKSAERVPFHASKDAIFFFHREERKAREDFLYPFACFAFFAVNIKC